MILALHFVFKSFVGEIMRAELPVWLCLWCPTTRPTRRTLCTLLTSAPALPAGHWNQSHLTVKKWVLG